MENKMIKIPKANLKEAIYQKFGFGGGAELAKLMGVSGQTVSNWINGRTIPPKQKTYEKLAEIFPEKNPHLFFVFKPFAE